MNDEPKVWIRKRKKKDGRTSYHLRWIDQTQGKWQSRKVGTDIERARAERALLQRELDEGTYTSLRRTTWDDFMVEHVGRISGARNATEAKRTLTEFGEMFDKPPLTKIRFGTIEEYADACAVKGNAQATVNKKLKYLRSAFNRAIRRGYLARNPMAGWQWVHPEERAPRLATQDEETALLDAAQEIYGVRVHGFVHIVLCTGGRRSEVMGLTWDRIDLDNAEVRFTCTKGKRDRIVPVNPEDVDVLRRLRIATATQEEPFAGLNDTMERTWLRIVRTAGVKHITIHDLRRTFCARAIRRGVELPTLQKLMGHADIKTTLRFYNWVSKDDLRNAVTKMRRVRGAG